MEKLNKENKQKAKIELKKKREELLKQRKLKLKQLKDATKEAKKEYKSKIKKLTFDFHEQVFALIGKTGIAGKQQQVKMLKKQYEHNKLKLLVEREYAIAKYQLSDSARDQIKMKADKKMSYHEYNVRLSDLKLEHQSYLKNLKKDHSAQKKTYKANLKKANNLDEKKALKVAFMNSTNEYESLIIKSKINFKNQTIQLQQERDLSYKYEIDYCFKLKRWVYGIGKEFQRMTWPSLNRTFKDYFVVGVVSIIIALIFLAVDAIVTLI